MPLLWGMIDLSSDTLLSAANRLLEEFDKLAAQKDDFPIQKLEQCAKALCSQLKAIQELEAHNDRQSQTETGQTYTRYEDLPPPSPAEQDRFYARLKSAIARIEDGTEI